MAPVNESKGIDRMRENTSAERAALARWESEGGRAGREQSSSATSAVEHVEHVERVENVVLGGGEAGKYVA